MAENKEENELEREERVIAAVTPQRSPQLAAVQQKLNFHEDTI